MKKLLFFTLIISSVTLAGLWSGNKVCHMMATGSSRQDFYSDLGLTAEQRESLKKTEASFRDEIDDLCMKVCEKRANLLGEMKDGKISAEAANAKVEEIGRLQISLDKKIIAHVVDLEKILTPAQSRSYIDKLYQQQCQMIVRSTRTADGKKSGQI